VLEKDGEVVAVVEVVVSIIEGKEGAQFRVYEQI
jgi:hypothetical protein